MIAQFENGFITKSKLNELVDGINANSGDIVDINAKSDNIIVLTGDVTKTVGSGGDFTTLNMAIDWCKKVIPNGYTVELTLVAGFIMSESILLEKVDLRFVSILSLDSNPTVIDRTSIIESYVFKSLNSFLPYIEVDFSMNGTMSSLSPKTFIRCEGLGAFSEYRGNLTNIEYFSRVYYGGEIKFVILGGNSLFGFDFNFSSNGLLSGNFTSDYYGVQLNWHSKCSFGNGGLTTTYNGILVSKGSNLSLPYGNVTVADTVNYKSFTVLEGGIISANGSTGTLSQTANTITSNGIIFK